MKRFFLKRIIANYPVFRAALQMTLSREVEAARRDVSETGRKAVQKSVSSLENKMKINKFDT